MHGIPSDRDSLYKRHFVERVSRALLKDETLEKVSWENFRSWFLYDAEIAKIFDRIPHQLLAGLSGAEVVDFLGLFWAKTISDQEPISVQWLSDWTEMMGTANFVAREIFLSRFNLFFASRENLDFEEKAEALGIFRPEQIFPITPLTGERLQLLLFGESEISGNFRSAPVADTFVAKTGLSVRSLRSFRSAVVSGERNVTEPEARRLWTAVYAGNLSQQGRKFQVAVQMRKKQEVSDIFAKISGKNFENIPEIFALAETIESCDAEILGELLVLTGHDERSEILSTGVFFWLMSRPGNFLSEFFRAIDADAKTVDVAALTTAEKIRKFVLETHGNFSGEKNFARLLNFLWTKFAQRPVAGRLGDFWGRNFRSSGEFVLEFCPFGVEALFYRFADDRKKLSPADAMALVTRVLEISGEAATTAAVDLLEICGDEISGFVKMFGFWWLFRPDRPSTALPCVHPEKLIFLDDFRFFGGLVWDELPQKPGPVKRRWVDKTAGMLEFPINRDDLEVSLEKLLTGEKISVQPRNRVVAVAYRKLSEEVYTDEESFRTAIGNFFGELFPGGEENFPSWYAGVRKLFGNLLTRERLMTEFFTEAEISVLWETFQEEGKISMFALDEFARALVQSLLVTREPEMSLISRARKLANASEIVSFEVFTAAVQLWRVYLVGWAMRTEGKIGNLWEKKFPGRRRITRQEYVEQLGSEISRHKNIVHQLFGDSMILEKRKFETAFLDERETREIFEHFVVGDVMEIDQLAMVVNCVAPNENVKDLSLFLTLADVNLRRHGLGVPRTLTKDEFLEIFPIWYLIR